MFFLGIFWYIFCASLTFHYTAWTKSYANAILHREIKSTSIQLFMFGFSICSRLLLTCPFKPHPNMPFFVTCVQDYHWWWRSFLTSGFTAVYLFIYAVHYFFSKLQIIGAASTILYFGYTMIMVLIFFLFTGELSDAWAVEIATMVSCFSPQKSLWHQDNILWAVVNLVCLKTTHDHLCTVYYIHSLQSSFHENQRS